MVVYWSVALQFLGLLVGFEVYFILLFGCDVWVLLICFVLCLLFLLCAFMSFVVWMVTDSFIQM